MLTLSPAVTRKRTGHEGSGWGLGQIVGVAVGVVITVSLAALLVGMAAYICGEASSLEQLLYTMRLRHIP